MCDMQAIESELQDIQEKMQLLLASKKRLRMELRELKRQAPEVASNKARAMLPIPEEISTTPPIWPELEAYEIINVDLSQLKKAFAAETWRKITNRLCTLLNCAGSDITLVYVTKGCRNGRSIQLLAFKNRINYRFKTFFDSLAMSPEGTPSFRPVTCTWTVPDTAPFRKIIGQCLHEFFPYVIDVRAGLVAKAMSQSLGFRPTFTKKDGIEHTKLLNCVVTYAYRAEQTGEKDWERLLRRYKTTEDHFLSNLAGVIPSLGEKILCVLRRELDIPTEKTIKMFILEEYRALSREVSEKMLQSGI